MIDPILRALAHASRHARALQLMHQKEAVPTLRLTPDKLIPLVLVRRLGRLRGEARIGAKWGLSENLEWADPLSFGEATLRDPGVDADR